MFNELSDRGQRVDDNDSQKYGSKVEQAHLFQGFVVDETGRIFREIKLSTLDLLSELPADDQHILNQHQGS